MVWVTGIVTPFLPPNLYLLSSWKYEYPPPYHRVQNRLPPYVSHLFCQVSAVFLLSVPPLTHIPSCHHLSLPSVWSHGITSQLISLLPISLLWQSILSSLPKSGLCYSLFKDFPKTTKSSAWCVSRVWMPNDQPVTKKFRSNLYCYRQMARTTEAQHRTGLTLSSVGSMSTQNGEVGHKANRGSN